MEILVYTERGMRGQEAARVETGSGMAEIFLLVSPLLRFTHATQN